MAIESPFHFNWIVAFKKITKRCNLAFAVKAKPEWQLNVHFIFIELRLSFVTFCCKREGLTWFHWNSTNLQKSLKFTLWVLCPSNFLVLLKETYFYVFSRSSCNFNERFRSFVIQPLSKTFIAEWENSALPHIIFKIENFTPFVASWLHGMN